MISSKQMREMVLEAGVVGREDLADSAVIGILMAMVDEDKLQNWYDAMRSGLDSQRVCVYCYGTWNSETVVCPTCEEYDGMVSYKQAMEEGTLSL